MHYQEDDGLRATTMDGETDDEERPLLDQETASVLRQSISTLMNGTKKTASTSSTSMCDTGIVDIDTFDDADVEKMKHHRRSLSDHNCGDHDHVDVDDHDRLQDSVISSTSVAAAEARTPARSRHDSIRLSAASDTFDNNTVLNSTKNESPRHSSWKAKANLGDYMYSELRRGYALENDEQRYIERRQKFYTFLKIPVQLEKFLWFGFFQCADAFLFVFTLLPIRFILSVWFFLTRPLKLIFSGRCPGGYTTLQPHEICDMLKGIIVIAAAVMMQYVDTSMLYHNIKTQSVIKLYIMFNMLEVADKLFSSFGQDILDALFWTATEPRCRRRDHLGVFPHLAMAVFYVFLHTILILLQATTLNVAINSKNKALLTIMMSNNFVELKGMVFKKFEKNNLFHMSCSDVRERFHYLILLIVVIIQTLKEYNWSETQMIILLEDSLCILVAEVIVDWLKHAFITRFNEIAPDVYGHYSISLAYDLAASKLKSAFSEHSDMISRRMGFVPLPLGVLVFRIVSGAFPLTNSYGITCVALGFLCLLTLKLWINIMLLGRSCGYIDEHRLTIVKKSIPVRVCTSLPSSRKHSMEDIHKAVKEEKLQNGLGAGLSKSTPHTPTPSHRSSLADISAQAALLQENLENSMILSDSQVSLNSLNIDEGLREARVLGVISETPDGVSISGRQPGSALGRCSSAGTAKHMSKSILRTRSCATDNQSLRRRVSLQEAYSNTLKFEFSDQRPN